MEGMMRRGAHRSNGDSTTGRSHGPRVLLRMGTLAATLLASSGCYSYFAANPASLEKGEQIRVVLESSAADRLAPALQQTPRTVEGDFERLGPDSLALAVWIGAAYSGTPFQNTYQTVSISRGDFRQVQTRRISKWRTGISAAVVLAGFAWGTQRIFYNPGRTPPPDGGGTTPPVPTGGSRVDVPISWILGALW